MTTICSLHRSLELPHQAIQCCGSELIFSGPDQALTLIRIRIRIQIVYKKNLLELQII
jgi:hypothetical protein